MSKEQKVRQSEVAFSERHVMCYLLSFFLLLVAYLPSFQAEWHFDDSANILENSPLHLTELTPAALKRTFFAYPEHEGTLLRPVSNLSFALNWFFHQDRVFGYHLVNFLIHFLTAVFLYKSCLLLLISPKVSSRYYESRYLIAALAALFWALNPIQTQAVTYIVQRMASLAAMFTIIGIWCYLQARKLPPNDRRKQTGYYFAAFIAFLLALGSKENSVLFPASIILVELIFFLKNIRFSKQNILVLLIGLLFIFCFTMFLQGSNFFINLFTADPNRSFTPGQRMLTQPRIVIFYLSQLFYPAPFQLSITHDFQLSSSLLAPFTTLPSIAFLTLLVILSFLYHRRHPIFSFAILFFLLNHIVESTFLNLELIFEHRNYLPSFFLFLPPAALLGTLLQHNSRLVKFSTSIATILLIISLLFGTIARNKVWMTEQSLWTDSLEKAPGHSRSYINLAHGYLSQNNLQKAFELYWLSLDKYAPNPQKARLLAYDSLGSVMFRSGNYRKALIFYDQALAIPHEKVYGDQIAGVLSRKADTLWISGQKHEALNVITGLAQAKPNKGVYLQQYGEMLIALNHVEEGAAVLQRVFAHSDMKTEEYRKTLLNCALVYARMRFIDKSSFYIHLADMLGVPVVPSSLYVIEISLLAGKPAKADQAMQAMLSQITWPELIAILNEQSPDIPSKALNYPLLRQYAVEWLAAQRKKEQ
ncbi:tetratricopeptide repeat protein [Desulfobulbus sp. F4]|nr:tetratricopeptide repeat protein [Desulfobulbus sp. F3]MCW5200218.1 tetratricopeptide repeat protein [Desulfobulbus sp. F4]